MAMKVTKNGVKIATRAGEIHGMLYLLTNFPNPDFMTALYLFSTKILTHVTSLQVGHQYTRRYWD